MNNSHRGSYRDSHSKMAAGSAINTFVVNDDVKHILQVVLCNNPKVWEAFRTEGITNIRKLYNRLSNEEVRKRMRYKESDDSKGELLDDEEHEEVDFLVSYLNWMQNGKGTILRCPLDIRADTKRESFELFLRLTDKGRGGKNGDGTVDYDDTVALRNEELNGYGLYKNQKSPPSNVTPPAQNNGGGNNNNSGGGSSNSGGGGNQQGFGGGNGNNSQQTEDAKKLQAFEKKIKPGDEVWTKLESPSDWSHWKMAHFAKLRLSDMGEIVKPGFTPPSQQNGDSEEACKLYEKMNIKLFLLLQDSVKTAESIPIIMKYSLTQDGVAIWKDLESHYDDDQSAVQKAKFLRRLITTTIVDPNKHKGLALAHNTFRTWVMQYNYYAETKEYMNTDTELMHYMTYMGEVTELMNVQVILDATEDKLLNSAAHTSTSEHKLRFYLRHAIRLDAEFQNAHIGRRRRANPAMFITGEVNATELWEENPYTSSHPDDALQVHSSTIGGTIADQGYLDYSTADLQSAGDLYSSLEVSLGEFQGNVFVGEILKDGKLPQDVFKNLLPAHRKIWLSFPREVRVKIVQGILTQKPPPTTTESHRLPGTGISSSRNARATNVASGDSTTLSSQESATVSERVGSFSNAQVVSGDQAIINAMQAHSLDRDSTRPPPRTAVNPARLLSSTNKSPNELIPILKNKQRQSNLVTGAPAERRVVMASSRRSASPSSDFTQLLSSVAFPDILGNSERRVSMAISSASDTHVSVHSLRVLIDGGANAGLVNINDLLLVRFVTPARYVNVTGIGESRVTNVRIGTFAAKVTTTTGEAFVVILHEHGAIHNGPTVVSKLQLEDNQCMVFDRPTAMNGEQAIMVCNDEEIHYIPILYHEGLPYVKMSKPTIQDMETLPQIELTSSDVWNPNIYDSDGSRGGHWTQWRADMPRRLRLSDMPRRLGLSEWGTSQQERIAREERLERALRFERELAALDRQERIAREESFEREQRIRPIMREAHSPPYGSRTAPVEALMASYISRSYTQPVEVEMADHISRLRRWTELYDQLNENEDNQTWETAIEREISNYLRDNEDLREMAVQDNPQQDDESSGNPAPSIVMNGVRIPRTRMESRRFDHEDFYPFWQNAETEAVQSTFGYDYFRHHNHHLAIRTRQGYQRVPVRIVWGYVGGTPPTINGIHKVRIVTGHHQNIPLEPFSTVYGPPRIVPEHSQGYLFGEFGNRNPFVIVTNEMERLVDSGANQGIRIPINIASIHNNRSNSQDSEESDEADYEDMPNLQEDGGEEQHVN